MAPGRSKKPWVVALAVVLIAAVAFGAWWFTRPAPVKGPVYDEVTVARSKQTLSVSLSGTIEPQEKSTAAFAVPGTIDEVRVKVGDRVKRGAPLARLDDRDLAAAAELARAQLDAAEAALTTAEDADGATDAQLSAARAQVKSAKASVTTADNRLDDATLVSPLDGTIAQVDYAVGDQVSGAGGGLAGAASGMGGAAAGAAAGASGLGGALSGLGDAGAGASGIVVIATDAWKLDATVGTADLGALKAGQRAVVTPTGTSHSVPGRIDTVGIVADTATGASATFPVTVTIDKTTVPLFAGSSADAVVTVAEVPDALAVPVAAVTSTDGATTVRKLTGGQAAVTPVTLGRRFGSTVEVTSGLAEGDVIQVVKAQAVAKPTQPLYGPNGRMASPAAASESPR